MRLPDLGWAKYLGGTVSRHFQTRSISRDVKHSRVPASAGVNPPGLEMPCSRAGVAALSIEFVAKPSEAHKVHSAVPAAIAEALKDVSGFGGCYVLISSYEARLVTIVTLWKGEDRMRHGERKLRWVRALLAPYLDRCLRVQTMAVYTPLVGETQQSIEQEMTEPAFHSLGLEESAFCVA